MNLQRGFLILKTKKVKDTCKDCNKFNPIPSLINSGRCDLNGKVMNNIDVCENYKNSISSTILKKEFFTVKELAEYLPDRPHVVTIQRLARSGKIPHEPRTEEKGVKFIFRKSVIDKWLENGRNI